jgi:hypothetical protein
MKTRTRAIVALSAGAATFGIVGASAASLGLLGSDGVGASDAVVASCDPDGASLDYTTSFNTLTGTFDVNGVAVSGLDASCDGKSISVVLKTSETGPATGVTFAGTVAGGGASLSGLSMTAQDVRGVSVIVTG